MAHWTHQDDTDLAPRGRRHRFMALGLALLLGWATCPAAGIEADPVPPPLSDPNLADTPIAMNFEDTDIRTVVQTLGDITGINFVLDDSVRGNVSVISPTAVRLGDAYRVLERVLDLNGFAAIPSGDVVKIVAKADAGKHNLPVRVGVDPNTIPLTDTLVTQIMPLTYAAAAEVYEVISKLVGTDAKISVYERTNALVITDTSTRIHYIATLVRPLDVPSPGDQVIVLPLENASAQTLSERLTQILARAVPTASRAPRPGTSAPGAAHTVRVLPEARINALVAIGTPEQLATVRQLVTELDVPRRAGTENARVIYLKNAQAKQVAESLTAALADLRIDSPAVDAAPPVQVTADEGTNGLIVTGQTPDFEMIQALVEQLDVPREQVLVELLILEVTQEKLNELGFDWQTLNRVGTNRVAGFGGTNLGPRVDFVKGDLEGLAVGAYKGALTDATDLVAILSALGTDSDVNLLSQPHITTQNHTKAKIVVADNRAFVTDSRIPGTDDAINSTLVTSYEYRDVGITMEITPHVNQGDNVRLEISSEISKLLEDVTVTGSVTTPTTAKRQAETVVTMRSGDTVVIGGLMRDDVVRTVKKVPLLGDIPGLGLLFRHSKDQVQKTNLLMFITAHVLGTPEALAAQTARKEALMPEMVEKAQLHRHGSLPAER